MSDKRFETPPDGDPLFRDVAVAGLNYRTETVQAVFDHLDRIKGGPERGAIAIRHEADNEHDPSAQMVDVVLEAEGKTERFHIGYLPSKIAHAVHLKQSAGGTVRGYLRDLDYNPDGDPIHTVRLSLFDH